MDWSEQKLDAELYAWLKHAAEARYIRDQRLDPFATSMRDFDDVSPNLVAIQAGGLPSVTDVGQRVVDLKNAGFLTAEGNALTDLGASTLAAWQKYGVATKNKEDELARHLLVVLEAMRLGGTQYSEYASYWRELRTSFDAIELIDNWDALYVLNYLDYEREGFAPGKVYRIQSPPVAPGEIEFDLLEYASENLQGEAVQGAERIDNAIGGKVPRGRHRATLAMAMELIESDGLAANVILSRFGHPKKPRDWARFKQAQKEKILRVLNDYGFPKGTSAAVAGKQNEDDATKIILPEEFDDVDFSAVEVPVPKPTRKPDSSGIKAPATAKKIDHQKKAENDAAVGRAGERFALAYERWRLRERPELQSKIQHVSETDDSLGYDIHSFELDGRDRFVEVKATLGGISSRFFISANEVMCAHEKGENYVLLRVAGLAGKPTCCEIRPPLDEQLDLLPASYQATFKSA